MKNVKTKVAGLVLAVGVAGGLMAGPAFGAAHANGNEADCRGYGCRMSCPPSVGGT